MGEYADMIVEQAWADIGFEERVPSVQEQAPDFFWVQRDNTKVHMLNMCERHLRFTIRKFEKRRYLVEKVRQLRMVLRLVEEQVHQPLVETTPENPIPGHLLQVLQNELERRRTQASNDRRRQYD